MVTPRVDEPGDGRGQRLLAGPVHAGRRLVHDQHLRLGGQRAGDQRSPLLAAGELGDVPAGPVASPTAAIARSTTSRSARASGAEQPATREPPGGDDLAHGRGDRSRRRSAVAVTYPTRPRSSGPHAGRRSTSTSPDSTVASPSSPRTSVVLPEPFAPARPRPRRGATVRSTSRTTARLAVADG